MPRCIANLYETVNNNSSIVKHDLLSPTGAANRGTESLASLAAEAAKDRNVIGYRIVGCRRPPCSEQ